MQLRWVFADLVTYVHVKIPWYILLVWRPSSMLLTLLLFQIFNTTKKLFVREFIRRTVVLVIVMFTLSYGWAPPPPACSTLSLSASTVKIFHICIQGNDSLRASYKERYWYWKKQLVVFYPYKKLFYLNWWADFSQLSVLCHLAVDFVSATSNHPCSTAWWSPMTSYYPPL